MRWCGSFRKGHLGALGTTPTDTLVVNIPVLLFCIAFGLSMDYEVFLISRIREFWLASGAAVPKTSTTSTTSTCDRTGADNDESVALGLAHTGRVITAAALVMVISFAALIAAHVSFMRMFGVGLTLAVLVDATLVRMVLVPAFMHILGRWNWWAPAPIARLHTHIRVSESAAATSAVKDLLIAAAKLFLIFYPPNPAVAPNDKCTLGSRRERTASVTVTRPTSSDNREH